LLSYLISLAITISKMKMYMYLGYNYSYLQPTETFVLSVRVESN